VYYGYVPKTAVSNHARFNGVGTTALFAQLGLPAPDAPATPLALTTASYQGVWDFRTAGTAVSPTNGITVFIGAGGTASCTDKQTGTGFACVVSITDTATGAFSFSDGGSVTGTGTLDFLSGTASAVFTDPTATPSTESVVGGRR